jgi:hypothetical protein
LASAAAPPLQRMPGCTVLCTLTGHENFKHEQRGVMYTGFISVGCRLRTYAYMVIQAYVPPLRDVQQQLLAQLATVRVIKSVRHDRGGTGAASTRWLVDVVRISTSFVHCGILLCAAGIIQNSRGWQWCEATLSITGWPAMAFYNLIDTLLKCIIGIAVPG